MVSNFTQPTAQARALHRGALVLVRWADITQSAGTDPDDAELTVWEQPGCWYGIRDIDVQDRSIRCVVIAGARTSGGDFSESGWTAIPEHLVLDIVPLVPELGVEQ